MDVTVGPQRKLCTKELMFSVVLEKTLESPLDCKEIKAVNPKGNQPWMLMGRTDAEAEAPVLRPPDERSWFIRKDLMPGKIEDKRKGDNRGWNGWMASPIQWTWTLANSRRWWGIGKPGVLQSMGSQRVGYNLVTEHHIVAFSACLFKCYPNSKLVTSERISPNSSPWITGFALSSPDNMWRLIYYYIFLHKNIIFSYLYLK